MSEQPPSPQYPYGAPPPPHPQASYGAPQSPYQQAAPPPPPRPPMGFGSPPGGPGGFGGPYQQFPQPRPQVVHVVSKPGGLARAFGFIFGLFLFAAVFIIGIIFGMAALTAASDSDSVVVRQTYRDGNSNTIAIIPIEGMIDGRQSEFIRAAVENVLKDKSVRAVVLRVDSPGGGVTASDQIWYEVNRLKNAGLPVIASYGGVAASGGYYVSCGADYIMAEETSITGSIGVIAQVLTFEGLMDKVGVKPVTLVASGSPEKNVANDMFRTWNDEDKAKIRLMLDSAYATFNQRVKDGRAKIITDPSKIDALANGSIYTAKQAKDSGLIDGIGYLDNAIAQAETLGGLGSGASSVIVVYQAASLFRGLMMHERNTGVSSLNANSIRGLVNDLASPRVMYLMN